MKWRQASPENEWRNFTPDHSDTLNGVLSAIDDVSNGVERDPIAVIGPYRTGKTQMLYEIFNKCWVEKGVPALYTDANSILNRYEDYQGQMDIAGWLSEEVASQTEDLTEGNDVPWLPRWSQIEKREKQLDSIRQIEGDFSETTVLLVDEIEQAYKKLRSGDFVDDDNPLRVLLDETSGIYQIWAFGLVAAYELGEADYARFEEHRIPILNTQNIVDILEEHRPEVDVNIATGLWWLSRGRVGWANKLIDEVPADQTKLAKWVRDLSEDDLEGLRILENEVWTESLPSKEWDAARRSILFLKGHHEEWEIGGGAGVTAELFSNLVMDILLGMMDSLGGDEKQILETHISRLSRNLSPISSREDGVCYIPADILNETDQAESFLELLTDLILSFEASTDARANLIRTLDEIKATDLRSGWSTVVTNSNEIDNSPPVYPWTIDLTKVDAAYPPVAVDPSKLTGDSTEDLKESINQGIRFEPDVTSPYIDYEVRFCPNKEILKQQCEIALSDEDLKTVYVLFVHAEEGEIDLSGNLKEIENLDRLHIVPQPKERLWAFILHLNSYLNKVHDDSRILSDNVIRDVLAEEDDRDIKNTISTLFSQVNEVSQAETNLAIRNFRRTMSRDGVDVPLWAEELSGSSGPEGSPPDVYGTPSPGARGKYALAFSLATSRYDITNYAEAAAIRAVVKQGIDNDLIEYKGNRFGFTQFVNSTLTNSGVGDNLESFWRRYHDEQGDQDEALENLQSLLEVLIEANEHSWGDILDVLLDLDRASAVPIVDQTKWDSNLTTSFIDGILLEYTSVRLHEDILDKLNSSRGRITNLRARVDGIQNEIQTVNETLQPPADLGKGVELKETPISDRIDHLHQLGQDSEKLIDRLLDDSNFSGIAIVYFVILNKYLELFNEEIEKYEESIFEIDFYPLKDLKGTYSQTLDILNQSNEIFEFTDYNHEGAVESVNEFADTAFDYAGRVGGNTISPDNHDLLKDLETETKKFEENLREFNQSLRKLERLIDDIDAIKDQSKERFDDFESIVYGGDD